MNTPAAIIYHSRTGGGRYGEYFGITVHYDGKPEIVGRRLNEHYLSETKIRDLIHLGNLSVLGQTLSGDLNQKSGMQTRAYGRDLGETGMEPVFSPYLSEVINALEGQYVYLYRNGCWWINNPELDRPLPDNLAWLPLELFLKGKPAGRPLDTGLLPPAESKEESEIQRLTLLISELYEETKTMRRLLEAQSMIQR